MSAPNIKELDWAISELEGQESSENRYMLLAALYTCRNQMLGITVPQTQAVSYSEMGNPISETLDQYGDSDFLRAVAGLPAADAWAVMDELMDTLQVVNSRAYDSVMRKLGRI